jgi:hypothetical protein
MEGERETKDPFILTQEASESNASSVRQFVVAEIDDDQSGVLWLVWFAWSLRTSRVIGRWLRIRSQGRVPEVVLLYGFLRLGGRGRGRSIKSRV